MEPTELLKDLEKGRVLPVYLFCGSEKYLMEETLRKVESLLVSPATRCFNYNLFDGSEATAEAIIDVAQTMPMMASRRVVVVKGMDRLSSAEIERLSRYIKDPSPSTCLILVAEKVDMRKGVFQAMKGSTVSFDPLHEKQLPSWIRREAESKGKRITPEAAQYLAEIVGNDLLRLKNELEKVLLYNEGREIGIDDVEAVSTRGKLKSIFDLTDAVGMKDTGKAMKTLGDLLNKGESGVYILYMVTRQLRQIWKVKDLLDRGMETTSIGRELGIPPFLQRGIISQAKGFSVKSLREAFVRLLEADASLKSGRLTDRLVLEDLFLNLTKVQA
jgi:DNA polymerase-3 subunit delta